MPQNKQKLSYTRAEVQALLEKIENLNTVEGKVQIMDVGAGDFDITTLDFSQYGAGDVVLVVGDMDGGASA